MAMMMNTVKNVHMVGIGGIGMSGIAEILLNQGFSVSGSDIAKSEVTDRLESLGIKIYEGHKTENLEEADVLVYSSAVTVENPEVKEKICAVLAGYVWNQDNSFVKKHDKVIKNMAYMLNLEKEKQQ